MQSGKKGKRIAFLVQLPRKVSPGQRFRIEQFEPLLAMHGFSLHTYPFIGKGTYQIYYKQGYLFRKAYGIATGILKRFRFLFKAYQFDYIFLQREAAPVGPPIFEWLLVRLLRKKIILDFDDAIWIPDRAHGQLLRQAKCYWKIRYLCTWAYKVSVGNAYLADWARQYNRNVILIPTCVDTQDRYERIKLHASENSVVIGWTGSHSTLRFLNSVYEVLKKLQGLHRFEFLVICDRPPEFSLPCLRFLPWQEKTEIDELSKIDIGIMPLEQDSWSEGKCGFKIIQYLALGIPVVASPIGVNKQIVDSNNGFLCKTQEEWFNALVTLLKDESLRTKLGYNGRQKVIKYYSLQANEGIFLKLFE